MSVEPQQLSPYRLKQIGNRMRDVRKRRSLSQVDIAEACQISIASVSLWERGETQADKSRLKLAAKRLGVDLDWLLTGDRSYAPELPPSYDPATARKQRRGRKEIAGDVRLPMIPEMVRGVGSGAAYSGTDEVHSWWSLPSALMESLHIKPDGLKVFPVLSDSLAPIIKRGSLVFIDYAQVAPIDGGIFAIDNNQSIILKRVHISNADVSKLSLSDSDGATEQVPSRILKKKIIGRAIGQFSTL